MTDVSPINKWVIRIIRPFCCLSDAIAKWVGYDRAR